jgi:hypothetical protein
MSNPERRGFNSNEEKEPPRLVQLELSERQLDAVLVVLHRELVEFQDRLEVMKRNPQTADDYDGTVERFHLLESVLAAIRAQLKSKS